MSFAKYYSCLAKSPCQFKKSITFAAENDTNVVEETCMVDKSKAELEAELAKVKKELE